jgi:hypothetical protein
MKEYDQRFRDVIVEGLGLDVDDSKRSYDQNNKKPITTSSRSEADNKMMNFKQNLTLIDEERDDD